MLIAVVLFIASVAAAGQQAKPTLTPQQLFESGKYQDAIDKIRSLPDAPRDQTYLRALAHRKLDQNDDAKEAFGKLAAEPPDSAWREIGNSGNAFVDGDLDAAETAAKKAVEGTDIPVVFAPVINPVEEGVVASIAQPGGNVTGVQNGNTVPKAMEWLHKIAPQATKIHVIYHPEDAVALTTIAALPETAATLGVELVLDEVRSPEEALAAIEALPKDAAIFMVPTPRLDPGDARIEAAVKHGLAVGSTNPGQLKVGAIVTYGANFSAMGKQAAGLVDQILKGTKPADLPVETAEYFLDINLLTAQAIGLDIPDEILRQAATVVR
jgi:ABC-type uncharacterized transport system substrate-binding protein